jgi:hypothetical protein
MNSHWPEVTPMLRQFKWGLALPLCLMTLACSSPSEPEEPADASDSPAVAANAVSDVVITPVAVADLSPEALKAAQAAIPGFVVTAVEKKVRDGRTYYDVEGQRPDGSEAEADILEAAGQFTVVELQRDIPWATVPEAVREKAGAGVMPVRVIESVQTDGTIIYELFAKGQPKTPAMEIRWHQNQAEVLTEVWPH